jgi:hemoglobin
MNEMNKKKIATVQDVRLMVDTFYGEVRKDALLGPIFNQVIQDRWPEHLEKMYRFWQTVLLQEHTYKGSPFAPHARLPLQAVHFERWKLLFFATLDGLFDGEKAEEAKFRASKMAEMFQLKIAFIQQHP